MSGEGPRNRAERLMLAVIRLLVFALGIMVLVFLMTAMAGFIWRTVAKLFGM